MVRMETPVCEFGRKAIDFALPDTNGSLQTLKSCRGDRGLLILFICNHCPYVKAIRERLVRDTRELKETGIGSVGIMSNDSSLYPEDSLEKMRSVAAEYHFPFPYVIDESQEIAQAYGAVSTPDFFGYNQDLELQYRGRLDASGIHPAPAGARRELFEALKQIALTGKGPEIQVPSMGCSIKWKAA
ncbi:MAG: thioredoxin family protein [Methylococcales bacterium]